MSALVAEPDDVELIDQVRAGSSAAYHLLYQRHQPAARTLALHLTHQPANADDLVAEAFARILGALRDRKGPVTVFRSYLLTTLRHVAYEWYRRDRRMSLRSEIGESLDEAGPEERAVGNCELSTIADAFNGLPHRWQAVLWHVEVEGHNRDRVATLLGLTPGGVSALAYRARRALRRAYLLDHRGLGHTVNR